MKLYNSMTKKKEEFKPIKAKEVSIYVCGPTVYNYIHIGNARPMIVFDTLRRTLEEDGYKVKFISNYTDIDDKVIKAAKELGVDELELANNFIEAYEADRDGLNALKPDYTPRVTEYMDQIIAFISKLIAKGFAYEINGDVYFDINKIKDYGKLTNFDKNNLQVGARVEENKEKHNPLDFTLWKKTNEGMNWPSPWSNGRPGWHTECVVMIAALNKGEMIDIHGGGMDLKFPHHENEIAQAQGAFNHNIANYWMHNGFINVDDAKMSKSLGNVKWAKDVVAKIGANVFRLAMLSVNYRAPLNFSEELIEATTKEIEKFTSALKQANIVKAQAKLKETAIDQKRFKEFMNNMNDDLNTSNAITVMQDTTKHLNQLVRAKDSDAKEVVILKNTIEKMLSILGIFIELPNIDQAVLDLLAKWEKAQADKDFTAADKYRQQLQEMNIL
jgi:cysteinyl-tRNA synthetase